jgi:hypothetical protein
MGKITQVRFVFWALLFVLALLAAVFGDTSHLPFLNWPYMDKLMHLLYMGALATLLARSWSMWPVVLTGSLLSILIELLQYFVPGRSCSVDDAIWGIMGVWFAWGLYQTPWYRRLLEFRFLR